MPVRTEEDLGDETIVTNGGGKTIASGESTHQTTEQGKQGNKKSKVGLTIRTNKMRCTAQIIRMVGETIEKKQQGGVG